MCYHCEKTAGKADHILDHELRCHLDRVFSMRVRQLDPQTGDLSYVSQHYGITLQQIRDKVLAGVKPVIDTGDIKLRFKRIEYTESSY